jgi:hypothetical protein
MRRLQATSARKGVTDVYRGSGLHDGRATICIGKVAWLASGGGTSAAGGVAAWVLNRRKNLEISKGALPATS